MEKLKHKECKLVYGYYTNKPYRVIKSFPCPKQDSCYSRRRSHCKRLGYDLEWINTLGDVRRATGQHECFYYDKTQT